MSYTFYKILHITAIITIFAALGGACLHAMNGGSREGSSGRGMINALHGIGLFVALVGGFGLLARMGMATGWPGWVYAKLVIWLVVGGLLVLPYRKPEFAKPLLLSLPVLGLAAAWLAIAKPF